MKTLAICCLVVGLAQVSIARTYVVDRKNRAASDQAAGTASAPFLTISRGAALAAAGDTVLVHAGIYRERVAPVNSGTSAQPITYLAAPSESVFIKGSDVWAPQWQPYPGKADVYVAKPDPALFGTYDPYHMRLAGSSFYSLGQIFVDGVPMREQGNRTLCLSTVQSWMFDTLTDSITAHFRAGVNPAQVLVEITTRPRVFAPHTRGLAYITVKGFIMEHCANQNPNSFWSVTANAQAGLLGLRSGNHWTILNNVIRYARSVGIDIGNEGGRDVEGNQATPGNVGYHLIQGNTISDNGTCGICGMGSNSTRIIGNLLDRNNSFGVDVAENAAIKTHNFSGGVISQNVIRNTYNANGIWMDLSWSNVRISRNLLYNNGGDGAMFFELGSGALTFDNNIVVNNRSAGVYFRDASNVTVVHNLVAKNSTLGVFLQAPDGRGPIVSNNKIFNNIIYRSLGRDLGADALSGPGNTQGCNAMTPGKLFCVDATLATVTDTLIDSILVDTVALTVRLGVRDKFFQMGCSPFTGVDLDFQGNAMPSTRPLAGPFQNLTAGINNISMATAGVTGRSTGSMERLAVDLKGGAPVPRRSLRVLTHMTSSSPARVDRNVEFFTITGACVGHAPTTGTQIVVMKPIRSPVKALGHEVRAGRTP